MKKTIISLAFIFTFVMYALYQNLGASGATTYVATNTSVTVSTSAPIKLPATKPAVSVKKITPTAAPKPTPKPVTIPVVQTPVAQPQPIAQKNMYADGTFTGSVADAYYGNIQVQIAISNGKIVDVQFLQYPNDRDRSVRINTRAMPILRSEAISAQSASVNIVSGATDSSMAFQQSLASALAQALN